MPDHFETLVIDSVLSMLTTRIGRHRGTPAQAPQNLLQLASSSASILELLTAAPGVVRLIEFRPRTPPTDATRSRLRRITKALATDSMRQISRDLHWVTGDTLPNRMRIRPYLAARNQPSQALAAETLLDRFVEHAFNEGDVPTQLVLQYLEIVIGSMRESDLPAPCLALVLDRTGALRYIALDDPRGLRETPAHLLALRQRNSALS